MLSGIVCTVHKSGAVQMISFAKIDKSDKKAERKKREKTKRNFFSFLYPSSFSPFNLKPYTPLRSCPPKLTSLALFRTFCRYICTKRVGLCRRLSSSLALLGPYPGLGKNFSRQEEDPTVKGPPFLPCLCVYASSFLNTSPQLLMDNVDGQY